MDGEGKRKGICVRREDKRWKAWTKLREGMRDAGGGRGSGMCVVVAVVVCLFVASSLSLSSSSSRRRVLGG